MADGVEIPVESAPPGRASTKPVVEVRMLGPLTIRRNGVALDLPTSRKVRGLFAYLAVAPHAVPRSQLCELLWDVPNDPRGELRWCLSKIRALIDEPDRRRVDTQADTVRLDLAGCFVDALEIARITPEIATIPADRLREAAALLAGDFLDGLEIDRSPAFASWLAAQRRRFRGTHTALLERLVASVPDEEALGHLEKWLELAPFDGRVHELLLQALARHGRIREGEEHLAATARRFEAESLDSGPVRDAWRSARAQRNSPPSAAAVAHPEVAAAAVGPDQAITTSPRRASIAVMPFIDRSMGRVRGAVPATRWRTT